MQFDYIHTLFMHVTNKKLNIEVITDIIRYEEGLAIQNTGMCLRHLY